MTTPLKKETNKRYVNCRKEYLMTLLRPFGSSCWYCGMQNVNLSHLHVEHIISIANGGTDDLENLALACQFCNMAKKSFSLLEFYEWLDSPKTHLFNANQPIHPTSSLYPAIPSQWRPPAKIISTSHYALRGRKHKLTKEEILAILTEDEKIALLKKKTLFIERIHIGLRLAKSNGKRLGRPPCSIDVEKVKSLRNQGKTWHEIGKEVGASRLSVQRVFEKDGLDNED